MFVRICHAANDLTLYWGICCCHFVVIMIVFAFNFSIISYIQPYFPLLILVSSLVPLSAQEIFVGAIVLYPCWLGYCFELKYAYNSRTTEYSFQRGFGSLLHSRYS